MAEKYILRVTAGPSYSEDTHVQVPVNSPEPLRIESETAVVELNVRIQNYTGLPRGSNRTSSYFSTEPHDYNQDQYSISFRFTPTRPESTDDGVDEPLGIRAEDLQFGNDFDRPIRDRLPPGFNAALGIVKWWIDPGLEGDAYADKPYFYGPALSSFNVVTVGPGTYDEAKGGLWFEEGGDDDGKATRSAIGAPDNAKARMKWALSQSNKEKWIWEYDRTYGIDFFNPYLDFANLAIRLPGCRFSVVKHLYGRGPEARRRRSHHLRYVLRHRTNGDVYFVVIFSLHLKEDVNEDGTLKESAKEELPMPERIRIGDLADGQLDKDEIALLDELEGVNRKVQTSSNDVD